MRKRGGGGFWNRGVGELDCAKSSLSQAHGEMNLAAKCRKFLRCVFAQLPLVPLSLGKQCNKNETFSLNALIKITYWFRSKTTGATFNLLCLLFGDLVRRGARGHSNIAGNPDRTYKRRCLFFSWNLQNALGTKYS